MKSDNKVYGIVTDKIISLLEKGTIPWEQKWNTQLPQNFVTKIPYRGFNLFYLYCVALENGYKSPYWLTYTQITNLKGTLKPWQKPEIVIKFGYNTWKDEKDLDENGNPKIKRGKPFLSFFKEYNIEQTEGIDWENPVRQNNPIKACEEIIENYKDCPVITHAVGTPSYSPEPDIITLPDLSIYQEPQYYYKSLFHEITHSTGHEKRLNRFKQEKNIPHTTSKEYYSKEELVAEFGSAFLCAEAGISNEQTEGHSASYINGWLQALKNDEKLIMEAASKAQRAVDYVKGEYKLQA